MVRCDDFLEQIEVDSDSNGDTRAKGTNLIEKKTLKIRVLVEIDGVLKMERTYLNIVDGSFIETVKQYYVGNQDAIIHHALRQVASICGIHCKAESAPVLPWPSPITKVSHDTPLRTQCSVAPKSGPRCSSCGTRLSTEKDFRAMQESAARLAMENEEGSIQTSVALETECLYKDATSDVLQNIEPFCDQKKSLDFSQEANAIYGGFGGYTELPVEPKTFEFGGSIGSTIPVNTNLEPVTGREEVMTLCRLAIDPGHLDPSVVSNGLKFAPVWTPKPIEEDIKQLNEPLNSQNPKVEDRKLTLPSVLNPGRHGNENGNYVEIDSCAVDGDGNVGPEGDLECDDGEGGTWTDYSIRDQTEVMRVGFKSPISEEEFKVYMARNPYCSKKAQ